MNQRIKLFLKSMAGAVTKKICGPHVFGMVVRSGDDMFIVDPEDGAVGRRLRIAGSYGLDEIERLRPYVNTASRVLIVGSHIGTLAVPLSRMCREVVAIEANPVTYEFLVRNIALNSISNCRALNIAASDKQEELRFLLSRANSGGSKRVPQNRDYMYYYDKPQEITVKAFSLDEYLDDHDFDVVVMDIEGSEYFALKGMQGILAKTKLLAVEFLPHHLKNVSSVSVAQFLSVVQPHFSRLTIPSRRKVLGSMDFLSILSEMYDSNQGDDAILFEKA